MTSRLCSITSTVLPVSTSRWRTSRSLRTSSKCRPGGRLVEDVERAARRAARQFLGELHALRLAARQGRRLLADMDVAEADLLQGQQLVADDRHGLEELDALVDRHVEHVGDRLAAEHDLERLAVVALALADVALDVDVGQEVHLDLDDAVALAGLAAAALDVEREAPGLVAALRRFGQLREPVADRREGAGVGRGVGARRAADRRLVDVDDLVEMADAVESAVHAGMLARIVEPLGQRLVERLDDQRALAAARHAGDAGEGAERDAGRHVLQVVFLGALDGEPAPAALAPLWRRLAPRLGDRDLAKAGEVLAGEAGAVAHHVLGRALGDHVAAMRGRRPGPCRPGGRRRGSRPRRARPPAPCCRGRAAGSASSGDGRCRAGAGRSTARPARRARRSGRSRSARRAGCAGFRRPTGCRTSG